MKVAKRIPSSILISSFLFIVFLSGCTQATDNQGTSYLSFVNTAHGVSIKYPSDWTKVDESVLYIASFISPKSGESDDFQENFMIGVEYVSPDTTLQIYTTAALSILEQTVPDMNMTESSSAIIDGGLSQKVVYSRKISNYAETGLKEFTVKTVQIWTIKNNVAYVFSFSAEESKYQEYSGIVNYMMSSVDLSAPQETMLSYKNDVLGIEINYPSNWAVSEQTGVVYFLSPMTNSLDTRENIMVNVVDISATPTTLDEYTAASLGNLEIYLPDLNLLESASTTLAGIPAYEVVYTGTFSGYSMKWRQLWAIKDNKVYTVTYTALEDSYDSYASIIDNMIDSFSIGTAASGQSL